MDTDKIEAAPPSPWIPEKDTMVRMVIGKLGEETGCSNGHENGKDSI